MVDAHKQVMSEVQEEENESGINIDLARQRMVEEDMFDKQLYREKIKKRHRVKLIWDALYYQCHQQVVIIGLASLIISCLLGTTFERKGKAAENQERR